MTSVKQPSNVTSITVSGSTLTPSGGKVSPATVADVNTLVHPLTRPAIVKSAANGDVTIRFPSIVTGITIGGVAYTPDGNGNIVVPSAVATTYLEELKYSLPLGG